MEQESPVCFELWATADGTFQKRDGRRNVHRETINIWVETFALMETHTLYT